MVGCHGGSFAFFSFRIAERTYARTLREFFGLPRCVTVLPVKCCPFSRHSLFVRARVGGWPVQVRSLVLRPCSIASQVPLAVPTFDITEDYGKFGGISCHCALPKRSSGEVKNTHSRTLTILRSRHTNVLALLPK